MGEINYREGRIGEGQQTIKRSAARPSKPLCCSTCGLIVDGRWTAADVSK